MQKKKWLWFILPVCAALGLLLFAVTRHTQHATGHMKLTVVDAYSFRAVPNAQIVLPEAGLSTVSDANGIAYLYGVPVHAPEGALGAVACDYGETTILVYAEGYLPFALFHAHVYENRMRNGPTLYLFPESTEDGLDVVSIIESPAEDWVKRLLDTYAP